MKVLKSVQTGQISDRVSAKLAMVPAVLKATLYSLSRSRLGRLGGVDAVTLVDLAREFRAGSGDAGICFEYTVHEAIASGHSLIAPLASEVLARFCNVRGEAQSILFGPEKEGVIPILESVQDALTEDSVVLVGNAGRPPKLRRYIPKIIRSYRRSEDRNTLPRSINGLWKADLFVGNREREQWIGTTVKINAEHLQGARGLRLGVYPKQNRRDVPRRDPDLNLVRLPLPYDGAFMEQFYKTFYLVRAFMKADGHVPPPVNLPDAEDRFLTAELEARREFPVLEVCVALSTMGQSDLMESGEVEDVDVDALLSEEGGLRRARSQSAMSGSVSLAPDASKET